MGLTGLRTGHTAGGCVVTRQTRAVLLRLVSLSRIPDLEPSYWASDIRAHLTAVGIQELRAQLYRLFISGLSCELPRKCGVPLGRASVGAQAGAAACLHVLLHPLVRLPLQ